MTALAAPALRIPTRPEMVFGEGAIASLPDVVRGLGFTTAFVVSDPGLGAAGVTGTALAALHAGGVRAVVFDGVGPNPSVDAVLAGSAALRAFGPAVVVGVGGGSPIDASKAIALHAANGMAPDDIDADDPGRRASDPLVAVPTTAGTGAETNAFGVIDDPVRHRKRYVGHASTMPRVAVLDPALTLSAPPAVTAACGIDVLAHAIESMHARAGNAYSAALALEAVRIVAARLPGVVDDGSDLAARGSMLLGAHLAALAFGTTGLGAAHAIGHALSARYGTAHGVALAAVLEPVVAQSLPDRRTESARIVEAMGVAGGADALPAAVGELCARAGLRPRLGELGVPWDELAEVADDALADPVIANAPRAPTRPELVAVLRAAF